jgi:hypothetical protein
MIQKKINKVEKVNTEPAKIEVAKQVDPMTMINMKLDCIIDMVNKINVDNNTVKKDRGIPTSRFLNEVTIEAGLNRDVENPNKLPFPKATAHAYDEPNKPTIAIP